MSGIGIDRDAGRALFCKEKNKRNIRTAGISCRLCRHRQDPVPAGKDPYGRRMVLEEGKEDPSVSVKAKDQKKGSYSFRVIKKNGKSRVFTLKLKKKTYSITVNKAQKQKNNYYSLGVKNPSLKKGSSAVLQPKGSKAAEVWHLESAGGSRFRLKNENSGLYLTAKSSIKKGTLFTQRKYSDADSGQIYRCYPAGSRYYYIKNEMVKEYLYVEGDSLKSGIRDNKKQWKFTFTSIARPAPRFTVTGETYPVSLNYGRAFSVK